ncbi:MAG: hypothetical protein RIC35_01510 [Marinoscillum sp.]
MIKRFIVRAHLWNNRKRNTFSFIFVFVLCTLVDQGLKLMAPNLFIDYSDPSFLDYSPELWVGLIALVLGTLIIVISIASQSTPKLISFFIGDYLSLMYSWALVYGLIHSFYSTAYHRDVVFTRLDSLHINVLIFLPLAALAAFPYILYILNFTKKSRIIRILTSSNERIIRELGKSTRNITQKSASKIHRNLFRGLNSLDDLFEYVGFKEPRSEIFNSFSILLTNYIRVKKQLPTAVFSPTPEMRKDISFRSLDEELISIQQSKTFYEFKTLQILSDIYLRLIKHDEYQLASQCGKEISDCGKFAVESDEESSLDIFFVTLNTLIRFSLKHGVRTGEVRNTYNLLFHYSEFVLALIHSRKTKHLENQSRHLCYYASEIVRFVPQAPAFTFLVDIVYLEFNKIIQSVCEAEFDGDTHMFVLEQYLCIGPSANMFRDQPDLTLQMINSNCLLKLNLSLYYLHIDQGIYADMILTDIRVDYKKAGFENTKEQLLSSCDRIEQTTQYFWESTDRGNQNIYYSPYKDKLNELRELIVNHPS